MPTIAPSVTPIERRIANLAELLGMLTDAPESWTEKPATKHRSGGRELTCLPCTDYRTLVTAWRKALRWRQDLDEVLAVMLSVALSTSQVGDQLFLQVIGDAGSGKTRLCEAMLVSKHCHPLEHLTGFHSGWKDESGNDYSLIDRINHKTLITPEGDVLMSSPRFVEIMSQQRRIFDGTTGASYKNRKEDMHYTGLRTPWIIAGTPELMATDQSRLGDRFLRICIPRPSDGEKNDILRRVGYAALRSVTQTSDGAAETTLDPAMADAYRLTGGYVDHLRDDAPELLSQVSYDAEWVVDRCALLGELTADARARPNPDLRKDLEPTKELPTRLAHQFGRLACCLAVVTNSKKIDSAVMRRVRRVAMDTGRGPTLAIMSHLFSDEAGLLTPTLAMLTSRSEEKVRGLLRFLRSIDVVEQYEPPAKAGVKSRLRWRLTARMRGLYARAIDDG